MVNLDQSVWDTSRIKINFSWAIHYFTSFKWLDKLIFKNPWEILVIFLFNRISDTIDR